jgi:hypothetical protein
VTLAGGKALVDAARAVEKAVEEKLVAAEKVLEAGLRKVGEEISELADAAQDELSAATGGLIDSNEDERRNALAAKLRDEESKAAAQRHLDETIQPQLEQVDQQNGKLQHASYHVAHIFSIASTR